MRAILVSAITIILCNPATFAKAEFVTVSLRPVANKLDNRIPNMPTGTATLAGVPFDLLPMSGNNSWDAEVGTTVGERTTQTMVLPVNIRGATAVDTLINTSQGTPGSTAVSLSFVCTDGKTHTVALKAGTDIRDWFQGDYVNSTTAKTTVQVHDRVSDTPSGRHGRIDKQTIPLPPDFANRTLAYIILTDAGVTGNGDVTYCKRIGAQRAFIYGVTVTTTGISEPVAKDSPTTEQENFSQSLLDETISKLKGKEAKQMADLQAKYKAAAVTLRQQRDKLDEEIQRETLKAVLLPSVPTDTIQQDSETLKAVDEAIDKAANSADPSQGEAIRKKEVLAAIDKHNVWDELTQDRQYKAFVQLPSDNRKQLLPIYRKYEPRFVEQTTKENTLAEEKKKDILKILVPDQENGKAK